jgi:type IV pilus assembly protein PilX
MKLCRNSLRHTGRQRGAALVISLLLLLVMTLLGLGASQSTRLQERMAGNQRDQELALQAGEAALRNAEQNVSPNRNALVRVCVVPNDPACNSYDQRVLINPETSEPLDLANQTDEWWETWARAYEFTDDLAEISKDRPPQYIVEKLDEIPEVLSMGDSSFDATREFYLVTARSSGQTDSARVVIQSTYARLVLE